MTVFHLLFLAITPDEFKAGALDWIAAGLAVALGACGALAIALPKIADLAGQVSALRDRVSSHGARIDNLALYTPPPGSVVLAPVQATTLSATVYGEPLAPAPGTAGNPVPPGGTTS